MRKIFPLTILIISSIALSGCGYTPEQRAVSGAALGGATGAAIGAATGRPGRRGSRWRRAWRGDRRDCRRKHGATAAACYYGPPPSWLLRGAAATAGLRTVRL